MSPDAYVLDDLLVSHFWERVDTSAGADGCWPWMKSAYPSGYGQLWWRGRKSSAHIVAFLLAHDLETMDGFKVCHHCDNPPCCNPRHLFKGTHEDNMADMVRKGRQNNQLKASRGCKNGRAVLNEAVVAELRSLAEAGMTHSALGRQYGVSHVQVRRIVRREQWR